MCRLVANRLGVVREPCDCLDCILDIGPRLVRDPRQAPYYLAERDITTVPSSLTCLMSKQG